MHTQHFPYASSQTLASNLTGLWEQMKLKLPFFTKIIFPQDSKADL